MMVDLKATKTRVAIGTVLLGLVLAVPAVASDTVTLTVEGEGRSASVSGASLEPVNYSHEDQNSAGTISLAIDDSSASDAGWNVTISAGEFFNGENAIPSENFSITQANAPGHVEGAGIDETGGPRVPESGAIGSLDTERKVLVADPEHGQGAYTQDLGVTLLVPGQTPAGEYTSSLTVNIAAGP